MAEFEERADQLPLDAIDATMAHGAIFQNARKKLLGTGAKLLVGPRGTGKTHLMRHTYLHALHTETAPIAIYANFSRYLNLEPLLKKAPDALKRFHSWVVAKLLLSCFDLLKDAKKDTAIIQDTKTYLDEIKLRELVSLLERGSGSDLYESFGQNLTVDNVIDTLDFLRQKFSRKRIILLLDDAALSLTDQYLTAFFEIYRLLKTETIAPKASVYPGSTQYGPTFHASHETEEVPLWLSVEDADYSTIMGDIATLRLTTTELSGINPDTLELLKFAAFGMPRAYLRLLREYLDTQAGSSQQKINKIIERQTELIGAEYDSLGIKLKQFASLVVTGRKLFERAVAAIAAAKALEPGAKNITLALKQDNDRNPLAERMLRFLVEVGMLYPLQAVSHGTNRKYDRFIPHLAFLHAQGVFREGRGSSSKDVPQYMQRPLAKQPLRRTLSTLLEADELAHLKLDLPACQQCHTARINESQRFCHNCGAELVSSSLFDECMKLPIEEVPGISESLAARIHQDTKLRTVGHVYASQNASGDLQQASYVGPIRASGIIGKVTLTVNEFLS
ncbi:ORC-CDC6 family AAA ATPase [Herbaspirillum autotrophicum]|uniref:ORC-CDC6 family AAA ATPase n=1 Tax=Herbaspirillum autotrophicum TaxID=180195 RepID=UPI00067D4EE9|nr:zinc ribbon domain-containing protein [Herbaspirillum autotrophicum]